MMFCLVGLLVTVAQGAITGTTVDVEDGTIPGIPGDLTTGTSESSTYIYVYPEQEGVTLSTDLEVDVTNPGTYNAEIQLIVSTISSGTRVDSYIVHFDTEGGTEANTLTGSVTFDRPVIGIIATVTTLGASDDSVGAISTTYESDSPTDTWWAYRDPELDTNPDYFILSGDALTVTVYFYTVQAMDEIRIITEAEAPTLVGLSPAEAYNLVDTEHCVTATVSPAVAGVEISFGVTGANPTSSTATTDESGEATFCYTGTAPGEDTITATLGDVDIPVTKYWFQDNFLTGGGTIKDGKKPFANISGNVGFLPDGTIVGNFNIVDHVNKNQYKCHNAFTSLVFSGAPATSPPASYNTATFIGDFTDKDGNVLQDVSIEIVDNDESGGGADTVIGIPLSGGNFQVHDGFK